MGLEKQVDTFNLQQLATGHWLLVASINIKRI